MKKKVQLKLPVVNTAGGKPAPRQAPVSQQENSAGGEPRGAPRRRPEQGDEQDNQGKGQGPPLKVNRKRINAAVWHDSPRVGHGARRTGSSICRSSVTRPLVSATLVLVAPEKGSVWLSSRRRRNGRETSEP